MRLKAWNASDPEYHTKVLTDDPAELRRTRAKIIRLAKGWNTQYTRPGLCSFNIEALALLCIGEEHKVPDGLAEFFRYAASDLNRRLTPDPAGVSGSIKLLLDRDTVVKRLKRASNLMKESLEYDNDKDKVREAMSNLYWEYIDASASEDSKQALASALRRGEATLGVSAGALNLGYSGPNKLKSTRAYGSERA